MAGLNFTVPDELHQAAKEMALSQRLSLKEFVTRAIAEKIARDSKAKP